MSEYNFVNELAHLRELFDLHNTLTQRAIDKAEDTMNKRLEGLNEFRAQQADTIARFATMDKLDAGLAALHVRMDGLMKELDELKEWRSNSQGRNQIIMILWPVLVGVFFFILNKYFKQ